jgi:hypothetical protein
MHRLIRIGLALFLPAIPGGAARGDLFLDLGAGTFVQEEGRQMAMAGTMGFRFGAAAHTELGLGVDYGRFLTLGGRPQVEVTGIRLASHLAPYPGDFQPLLGAHAGMARLDGAWKTELGVEAQALAAFHDRFQGYASVNPGLWIGPASTEIWVKLGVGLRVRLSY